MKRLLLVAAALMALTITACAGGDIAPLPSPTEPTNLTGGGGSEDEPAIDRDNDGKANMGGSFNDDNATDPPPEDPEPGTTLDPDAGDITEPDAASSADAATTEDAGDTDAPSEDADEDAGEPDADDDGVTDLPDAG